MGKGTFLVPAAHGAHCRNIPTLKGSMQAIDPFRVGDGRANFPGGLPPATKCVPFKDQNGDAGPTDHRYDWKDVDATANSCTG